MLARPLPFSSSSLPGLSNQPSTILTTPHLHTQLKLHCSCKPLSRASAVRLWRCFAHRPPPVACFSLYSSSSELTLPHTPPHMTVTQRLHLCLALSQGHASYYALERCLCLGAILPSPSPRLLVPMFSVSGGPAIARVEDMLFVKMLEWLRPMSKHRERRRPAPISAQRSVGGAVECARAAGAPPVTLSALAAVA